MTRLGPMTTDKQESKKALRKAGRKIALRGQAYVSMPRMQTHEPRDQYRQLRQ